LDLLCPLRSLWFIFLRFRRESRLAKIHVPERPKAHWEEKTPVGSNEKEMIE
jgi:hypothetical protein